VKRRQCGLRHWVSACGTERSASPTKRKGEKEEERKERSKEKKEEEKESKEKIKLYSYFLRSKKYGGHIFDTSSILSP